MTISTAAPAGSWTGTGALPAAATATWYGMHDGPVVLDDDGTVLVAGGADATSTAIDGSAVRLPGNGLWQQAGHLVTERRLHTMTLLPDGNVLATGGLDAGGQGVASAELYNPDAGTWTDAEPMAAARWGHSAVLLPGGFVLVAGGTGARSGTSTSALRSAELYNAKTGKWKPARAMTDARTGHTAVVLSERAVLVVGGSAPVGAADDPALAFCELYDPHDDKWTPTGSLLRGRRHHQATRLSENAVLVTGGTAPGSPGTAPYDPFSQRTAEVYDLAAGTWSAVRPMPSGRAFHRAILLGEDQVLVTGGAAADRDESGYRSALVYDVTGDRWTPVGGLVTGRWSFAATALPDGRVLVAGGTVRSGLAAADPGVAELTPTAEVFAVEGGS